MLNRNAKKGRPTPALDERVELYPDLLPVWRIFDSLHSSRRSPSMGGPQPLSPADVIAELTLRIPDADLRAEWYDLIRVLDSAWLGWARRKMSKKSEAGENGEQGDAKAIGRDRRRRRQKGRSRD